MTGWIKGRVRMVAAATAGVLLIAAVLVAGPFLIVHVTAPDDGVLRYLSWEQRSGVLIKGRTSFHISFRRFGAEPGDPAFRLRCLQPGWPMAFGEGGTPAYGYAGYVHVVIDACRIVRPVA